MVRPLLLCHSKESLSHRGVPVCHIKESLSHQGIPVCHIKESLFVTPRSPCLSHQGVPVCHLSRPFRLAYTSTAIMVHTDYHHGAHRLSSLWCTQTVVTMVHTDYHHGAHRLSSWCTQTVSGHSGALGYSYTYGVTYCTVSLV